jgi:hypothetical protein
MSTRVHTTQTCKEFLNVAFHAYADIFILLEQSLFPTVSVSPYIWGKRAEDFEREDVLWWVLRNSK